MTTSLNPVDIAMADNRLAKHVIRTLWLEVIKTTAEQYPFSTEPWYLTLPGAEGRDIQLLINEGLISLTEVNSIAEEDQWKIVAVERNNSAVSSLQGRFIGLKIKQVDFASLIHGEGLFAWPGRDDTRFCRAHVINLDLNSPLKAEYIDGQTVFPTLEWIKKLCHIHARAPRIDWTLFLTLHGALNWPTIVNNWTKSFLEENMLRDREFANICREFFGEHFIKFVHKEEMVDFLNLTGDDLQNFIMVLVPKIITKLVHNEGWRVQTEKNLKYGGEPNAPMITWIVKFIWDEEATATPDTLYKQSLQNIFSGIGIVTNKGDVQYKF